jgi:hypothetical protein
LSELVLSMKILIGKIFPPKAIFLDILGNPCSFREASNSNLTTPVEMVMS